LKLANTFVLTTRGVPQLYYGDEIAMEGGDEPTTRRDFPGGFPNDARNAFIKQGRTAVEQDLFEYVRKVAWLHTELEPLKRGALVNLYVAAQQYAYARVSDSASVIIAINNDTKPATLEFDVSRAHIADGARLTDRLDASADARITDGKLKVSLPARSASILTVK
jgi:glycosidase